MVSGGGEWKGRQDPFFRDGGLAFRAAAKMDAIMSRGGSNDRLGLVTAASEDLGFRSVVECN